ncbi:MAG TPA: glycosyltransferase 87 family protein [Streptosporangiaceae bacterium]
MQAQAGIEPAVAPARAHQRRPALARTFGGAGLVLGALLFALSLTGYLVDQAVHRHAVLTWYDLNVYNDAGLITRQLPAILYTWELKAGIQFTYTPFAAVIFAGGSMLKFSTLRWIMTSVSLAAVPLTVWLTLGGMGRRGASRLAAALAVSALALWIQPVAKALFLGQIEPLLMLLVVWDLTRPDRRRWKGIGIGLAAGIKLVPLIFIPYLLLAGKFRQALVATATFAATIMIGFFALPGPSASYWLTGYFIRPGRTGSVHSLVNQSLLAFVARLYGTVGPAQGPWIPLALAVAVLGVVGGAMLSRTGRPVQGWTLVGITSVLVSPISWDHHWVWIVPFMALLAGLAMQARPLAKAGFIAAIVAVAAVLLAWPWRYSGPRAWVPSRGLLGWFIKPPQITQVHIVHGWQLLTWNLWVAVGSVIYLALLATAVVVWRRRPRPAAGQPKLAAGTGAGTGAGARSGPGKAAAAAPEAPPAGSAPALSPIDALLARADAILKAGSGILGPDGVLSANGGAKNDTAGEATASEAPANGAAANGGPANGAAAVNSRSDS